MTDRNRYTRFRSNPVACGAMSLKRPGRSEPCIVVGRIRVFPQGLNPATRPADSSSVGTLANVSLRVDHDLVWLRRRVRAVAELCGLDDRGVHSLSAASYEAARLLLSQAGMADAAIVVSPASELQVIVSAITAEAAQLTDSLAQPLAALQAAVERVSLQQIGSA